MTDRRAARVGAALLLAGAAIGAITLLIPHRIRVPDEVVWAIVALSGAAGGVLWAWPERFGIRSLSAFAALGTTLITVSIAVQGKVGTGADDNEMLYVLVVVFAAWYLPPRHATAHVVLIGIGYAVLLAAFGDPAVGGTRWITSMLALAVVARALGVARGRMDGALDELADLARRDSLTGLVNRRELDARLGIERSRVDRTRRPVSVIVGDLDRFKAVNDEHGHAAGDTVLRRTARVLEEETRPVDVVARYGGEEFAVVLPDCDADEAAEIAERLRRCVATALAPSPSAVTISLGIASTALGHEVPSLLAAADRALYDAKQRGRDRVSRAPARVAAPV